MAPSDPKRVCDIITGDETWIIPTVAFQTNNTIRCGWVLMIDERPMVLRPVLQRRKRLFLQLFFNSPSSVVVDILPDKSTVTAKYDVETVLPKVMRSVCEQCPTVGTRNTLLLHDNASAHKAKVTVTYLEEQSVQVLPQSSLGPL